MKTFRNQACYSNYNLNQTFQKISEKNIRKIYHISQIQFYNPLLFYFEIFNIEMAKEGAARHTKQAENYVKN